MSASVGMVIAALAGIAVGFGLSVLLGRYRVRGIRDIEVPPVAADPSEFEYEGLEGDGMEPLEDDDGRA